MAKLATGAFGTITPAFNGSCKVGLDANPSDTPIVRAVARSAVAKWTVQNFDNAPGFYRLFINDGKKDYALNVPDDKSRILAFEGSPASSHSHVWYISHFPDRYYCIQDPPTRRAWKLNGKAIELATLPAANDGLHSFKFTITFSG